MLFLYDWWIGVIKIIIKNYFGEYNINVWFGVCVCKVLWKKIRVFFGILNKDFEVKKI